MNIVKLRANLEKNLILHLDLISPNNEFKKIYTYALLPPGKLFRPLLALSIHLDFAHNNLEFFNPNEPVSLLASALEIHHAYTLIHDDLPSMDNDDYRRGKLSTHKKYGQWQAILAGDGLLNASYYLLSCIDSPQTPKIIKIISHFLGPKGLIDGQVIDLSENKKLFPHILKMHELKTSRLIQCAIMASYLLSTDKPNWRTFIDLLQLGKHLGIVFQFLDDLSELNCKKISKHESNINPWLNYLEPSYNYLQKSLDTIHHLTRKHHLDCFRSVINEYLHKNQKIISDGQLVIETHLKNQNILMPIMNRLDIISNA